jgi:hypothetical protein
MTAPQDLADVDLSGIRCARRFAREQGLKANGQQKLRAIDDETDNGVNACVQPTSKMVTDAVDKLVGVTLALSALVDG